MGLKKKIAVSLAAGALALGGMFVAPVAASATGNPHQLDQGDLTNACRIQPGQGSYGWNAQLYGNTAYSWKCVYLGRADTKTNVDINHYCQTYWGVWAATRNPNSPYSWYCQGY